MAVALVPYRWVTDNGMPHWALPGRVTSAIDLRPLPLHADIGSTGYAVAVLEGDLPDGAVELETGNETRDRDAWRSTLGFRPAGANACEWVFSHLMDGADDTGEAACRPLRGAKAKLELWLDGKHERQISDTDRLRQQVYTRRDLDKLMNEVEAGKLPLNVVRKTLRAYADEHGIDVATLRPKSARWRNVQELTPETSVLETWFDGSFKSITSHNGWTAINDFGEMTTGNASDGLGPKVLFTPATSREQGAYFWNSTVMSNNRTSADLRNVKIVDPNIHGHRGPSFGGLIGSGSSTGYFAANDVAGQTTLYKTSGPTGFTYLSGVARTSQSRENVRVWSPVASSIAFADRAGAAMGTVTDTTYTTLNRVGLFGYNGGGSIKDATSWAGRDFLTPTVSAISPSTGSTAGGTAVTITGTGFEATTTFTSGGAAMTSVVIGSETSATAVTPAGTAGAKDIVATNADSGFTGTLAGGFTYAAGGSGGAPQVVSLSRGTSISF